MRRYLQLTCSCRSSNITSCIYRSQGSYRAKSTTSAIRSGLRAEASATGGRTRSGRPRPSKYDDPYDEITEPRSGSRTSRFSSNNVKTSPARTTFGSSRDKPTRPFDQRRSSRNSTTRLSNRRPSYDDDNPSPRTSTESNHDRVSRPFDQRVYVRGTGTGLSNRPSSYDDTERPVRASLDSSRNGSSRASRNNNESFSPSTTRSSFSRSRSRPSNTIADEHSNSRTETVASISSRRERRAAFWEQKKAEKGDDRGLSTEKPSDRSDTNRSRGERRSLDSYTPRSGTSRTGPRSHPESPADDVPIPVKYTTAASQFLYGANVVIATLAAQRRKIYHLYMHKRAEADNIAQIRRTATELGVPITRTADTALLDQLSQGRPHNGVVLETSPLPARSVDNLKKYKAGAARLEYRVTRQTPEEREINGHEHHHLRKDVKRMPVVVFLDGITDPGNLGNILRSAHFLGIDAVAIANATCASLDSPIVAKASSGACEAIPILTVRRPGDFVAKSADLGWTVCAAVPPQGPSSQALRRFGNKKKRQIMDTTSMLRDNVMADKPRLLLIGSEGEGLREYLMDRATLLLTIPGSQKLSDEKDVKVDSMNVGVAAGILMHAMVSAEPPAVDSSPSETPLSAQPPAVDSSPSEPPLVDSAAVKSTSIEQSPVKQAPDKQSPEKQLQAPPSPIEPPLDESPPDLSISNESAPDHSSAAEPNVVTERMEDAGTESTETTDLESTTELAETEITKDADPVEQHGLRGDESDQPRQKQG